MPFVLSFRFIEQSLQILTQFFFIIFFLLLLFIYKNMSLRICSFVQLKFKFNIYIYIYIPDKIYFVIKPDIKATALEQDSSI